MSGSCRSIIHNIAYINKILTFPDYLKALNNWIPVSLCPSHSLSIQRSANSFPFPTKQLSKQNDNVLLLPLLLMLTSLLISLLSNKTNNKICWKCAVISSHCLLLVFLSPSFYKVSFACYANGAKYKERRQWRRSAAAANVAATATPAAVSQRRRRRP